MLSRRSTLHLGRIAGIPIGVQPLWLLIVGLITWALGHDFFPSEAPGISEVAAYALGLASALLLFAGILLHELGHGIVARRRGVAVEEIDLWLLGGVSRLRGEPNEPGDELRFALAGPAVTAVIVAVAGALRAGLGGVLPDWGRALLDYQLYVNALILGFNLLPAFPLDGGRVTRALLWRRMGDRERATDVAAAVGRAFGIGMAALGVFAFLAGSPSGLWLALIGWFLVAAGAAEAQHQRLGRELGGETAGELMSRPAVTLPASLPLDQAAAVFGEHLYSGFPVVGEDGRALGVLTIDGVRGVPAHVRPDRVALDAAARSEELLTSPETPVIELLERPEFQDVGRAVVVDAAGRPLGLVSMTDVQRRLRAAALRA